MVLSFREIYDKLDMIPFDKLEAFFTENFK